MNKTQLNFLMLRIRLIEEEIAKRYNEEEMRCPVHLSIGQEAAAVGVCSALALKDKVVSTHRGHAHYLAKGGALKGLIGELYGKSIGCSRGNGGSMHLIDLNCGFYGSTSIVGGTVPIGVGLAFADRFKDSEATTVIFTGDAAVEEGVFHESANFAALHKLNVIFVCENNLYSCYTRIEHRQPNRPLRYIARAHNLNYVLCQPNDVEDIYLRTKDAIHTATYHGPVFMEIPTYRFIEHCGPNNDDHLGYRSSGEIEHWKKLDPIKTAHPDDFMRIEKEIREAWKAVEASPFPGDGEAGLYVYKNN